MPTECYPSGREDFRRQADRMIEALLYTGVFLLPFFNERVPGLPLLAQMPFAKHFFQAAVVLWAVRKLAYGEPFLFSRTAFFLLACAAYGWARLVWSGGFSAQALEVWMLFLNGTLIYIFASDFFAEEARCRRFIFFFLGWALLACASGVWQMLSPGGADFLAGRPADVPAPAVRMTGPFGSANGFATLLLVAFPLAMAWLAGKRSSTDFVRRLLPVTLFGVCLAASRSRGAWLAAGLTVAAFAISSLPRRYRIAFGVLAAISSFLWGAPLISGLEPGVTWRYRLNAWKTAWEALRSHPAFGSGLGSLSDALWPIWPDAGRFLPSVHNSYLEIAAETGIAGLGLFLAAVFSAVFARGRETTVSKAVRWGLIALALHACVDIHFQLFKFSTFFWLFAGLLHAQLHPSAAGEPSPAVPVWRPALFFSAFGAAAFWIGLGLPFQRPTWGPVLLDRAPFWAISALVFSAAVFFGKRLLRAKFSRTVLAGCLLASGAVFALVPPQLRVLSDEANLLMVSRSMAEAQKVDYAHEGLMDGGQLRNSRWTREIRPYLHPLLAHLLHRLTGYRPENVFVLNFFVLAACLFTVYVLFFAALGSRLWGLAAALAVLAQPINLLSAASGGFEMLQLLLVLGSLAATRNFLASPQDETRFRALWFSLLLLSQIRYESALFGLAVLGTLAAFKQIPLQHFTKNWIYPATPFLLLPWFWQRLHFWSYWPPSVPASTPLYSWGAFADHFVFFLRLLADYSRYWPYNPLLMALGLVGIAQLLRMAARPGYFREKLLYGPFSLAVALISAGLCAYAESGMDLPQSARYFVLGGTTLSLAAIFGLRAALGRSGAWVGILVAALSFLYFLPAAAVPRHWERNKTHAEYRFATDYRKTDPAGEVLWIVRRPVAYLARNESALFIGRFFGMTPARFAQEIPRGKRIWAVLEQSADGQMDPSTRLPASFEKKILARRKWRGGEFQLVELRVRPAPRPANRSKKPGSANRT